MSLSTRGRPATGRTTKTVRVPNDMEIKKAVTIYYDWLPIIEKYRKECKDSPRYEQLRKLLEELKE
jgi:hypothetical protein